MSNILITGAAGTIGQAITRHLAPNFSLTLVDRDFIEFPIELAPEATKLALDLGDSHSWEGLLDEVEYIIHLAGNPNPFADFDQLWVANFMIPKLLFEHAVNAPHLKRLIFASSIHAVDGYPKGEEIKISDPIRPDGYYGISKLFMETVANFYAHQKGIQSIGIRIGNYTENGSSFSEEIDLHGLAEIITEKDFNHLLDCCLNAEMHQACLVINGISNNSFKRLEIVSLKALLGYEPTDNAFEIADVKLQAEEPTV